MVDAVITYVDSADITWQNEYTKFVKRPLEECLNRFRAYGVLDLQIKLIRKFLPFVDKVFVIVSSMSQVPDIVRCMDDVRIVLHKEIIPKMFLPCFNSCTIEMFLHNIQELSEQFLYFNDDIFPVHACKETDFFSDGKVRVNYMMCTYDEDNATIFQKNVMNSTSLFYKKNEILYNGIKPEHSVLPMLKSACKDTFESNNDRILNSLTRTRHSKNINAYAPLIYLFKANKRKRSFLGTKYFYTTGIEFENLYIELDKTTHFICINDNDLYNDFDRFKIELMAFLECLLEDKPYEAPKIEENTDEELVKSLQATNEVYSISNDHQLKVALCAIAKNENLYIREWVEWYKNLGINKIFLYDNNELDGERFEEVINDYIESGFVEVIDVRGVEKGCVYDEEGINLQTKCYIECYKNKVNYFDWVCFFDVDEFLSFKNNYTLYSFLNDARFKNYDTILVGWEHYDDNNLLIYDNRPVTERFTHISKIDYHGIKSIVRTHKEPINIHENNVIHTFRVTGNNVIRTDYIRHISQNNWFKYQSLNGHNCVLNHYKTKTAEEYIKRHLGRHWGTGIQNTKNPKSLIKCINEFFKYNEKTPEKLSLFYREKTKNQSYNNKIIVTLTSWKGRINNVYNTLLTILNNTCSPYKLVLNLAIEEFPNKENDLPQSIIQLLNTYNNFELFWVDKNNFVFKKLIPTINRYKDNFIITIDDDVLYPLDFIENILCEYKKYGCKMPMSFGGVQSDWKINNQYIYSHYGAGSIVKYEFYGNHLNELYENVVVPALNNNIKMYDDVLYTYAALLNGYKYIRNLKYSVREYVLKSPNFDTGYSSQNNEATKNSRMNCHDLFRNYIQEKYNLDIDSCINNASSNGGIIVNLTTWLKRDWCVPEMLHNFKNQTIKPNEIILWLSYDEYKGVIPEHLLKCLSNRLLTSIRFVNGNTYGHKRYETFKTNNNCINILVDDDILYWDTYVEELVNACKKYPYHSITYCSTEIEYNDITRTLIPIHENNISAKNVYMSGLSAFPPQTFPVEMFNFTDTRDKYSSKCDDSWVRAWLLKLDIPMLVLHNRNDYSWKEIENTQSVGIWKTFNKERKNGILQVIRNFANSIFSINGELIAKKIWPEFNLRKCIGSIAKANIAKYKNNFEYIPYIYNGNVINTERLKDAIITDGNRSGKFENMNLETPKLIFEKIQYLKVYDSLTLKSFCSDKILLHEYCKEKIGKDICIPIIKIYDTPENICLNELPNKFVLKCNHGYKMNIICDDKSKFNLQESINKCKEWLNIDFGLKTMQFQYSLINRKCFIEKFMTNGSVGLTDYKFWCQNGDPKFVMVINDRYNEKKHANIYDLSWKPYDLGWDSWKPNYLLKDDKPKSFDLMIKYAKKLSKDFTFVRVDFYEIDGQCYLGELTFTPDNGFFHFYKNIEIELGNSLNL